MRAASSRSVRDGKGAPGEQHHGTVAAKQMWANIETMERTTVQRGVAKQLEMIALETYDRDREPEPHGMPRTLAAFREQGVPERCGTGVDAILESEALVEMGALGKNQATGPWWDRIRQVSALLNQEELPGWAEY